MDRIMRTFLCLPLHDEHRYDAMMLCVDVNSDDDVSISSNHVKAVDVADIDKVSDQSQNSTSSNMHTVRWI